MEDRTNHTLPIDPYIPLNIGTDKNKIKGIDKRQGKLNQNYGDRDLLSYPNTIFQTPIHD